MSDSAPLDAAGITVFTIPGGRFCQSPYTELPSGEATCNALIGADNVGTIEGAGGAISWSGSRCVAKGGDVGLLDGVVCIAATTSVDNYNAAQSAATAISSAQDAETSAISAANSAQTQALSDARAAFTAAKTAVCGSMTSGACDFADSCSWNQTDYLCKPK